MYSEREQALVERAKTDPDAFAELYNRNVDRIYTFVYRRVEDEMAAQDITATTFEKALNALPSYRDLGVGFCAWLYKIAQHEIVAHQRRWRLTAMLTPDLPGPVKLDWLIEHDEELATLRAAIGRLSNADQELLALRFFEELSSAEVAAVLDCKPSVVYVRLHRALKRLADHFEQQEKIALANQLTEARA